MNYENQENLSSAAEHAATQSVQSLFNQLQAIDLKMAQRKEEMSKRHDSVGKIVKVIGGQRLRDDQSYERGELYEEYKEQKRNLIMTFPLPNTKEGLLEFLTMTTGSVEVIEDYTVSSETEVWLRKSDQIYQKIVAISGSDKEFLMQGTRLVVPLMKRLPKKYKQFTKIPNEAMAMMQEELNQVSADRKKRIIKLLTKWGMYGGACLIVAIIAAIVGIDAMDFEDGFIWWIIFIVALIGIYVVYRLGKKEYKNLL